MSKIGRKPIPFSSAKVTVEGQKVKVKGGASGQGSKVELVHELPDCLGAKVEDNALLIEMKKNGRESRALWGLHRALLSNKIQGAEKGFELPVKIVGLGYKAQLSGKKMVFSLGYSHKVNYTLPDGVTVDIDKSGQNLVFKSHDKMLLGSVCDKVRNFRLPEPYKGTGIIRAGERIIRKAGKTGGAA